MPDQLIRIDGATASQFDVWIVNLYIIAARIVDIQIPRDNNGTAGQVNLWTSNVTLQDTPTILDARNRDGYLIPPQKERHDGVLLPGRMGIGGPKNKQRAHLLPGATAMRAGTCSHIVIGSMVYYLFAPSGTGCAHIAMHMPLYR